MCLVVEGPTTDKLMEEMQQAAIESTADIETLQVELGGLYNKIEAPAKWHDSESPYLCWGPVGIGSLGLV